MGGKRKNLNVEKAIELYKSGSSLKDIAKEIGCSANTISKRLRELNVKPKGRSQIKWVNESYFNDITTEEQAYLLGFFIADGCIRIEHDSRNENWQSTRLCFTNSIDDSEIINRIHEVICPNNQLQYVHNKKGAKNRKPQIGIQWTSYEMVDVLVNKYHILPKKTYDLEFQFPFNTIPEELHRHFIRGFMDGDGSINNCELRFIFNSRLFMNQVIDKFKQLFVEHEDSVWDFSYTISEVKGKTCNYWKVFIPMGHGRDKLIKTYLYKNATIYLKRKYNKAYNINE